jgi:hypothetical protein
MFRRVAGRPVLACADLAAQRRRTMSRCQRRIVSGVTSNHSLWRRVFGITLSRAASRARSAQFSFGRRGCRRWSMASWWRRIKISAVFHPSSRRDRRSHAVARVIRRKRNRRHMIGDHHRRAAGRTTLLVTTTDEILGTHRGLPWTSPEGAHAKGNPYRPTQAPSAAGTDDGAALRIKPSYRPWTLAVIGAERVGWGWPSAAAAKASLGTARREAACSTFAPGSLRLRLVACDSWSRRAAGRGHRRASRGRGRSTRCRRGRV